MRASKKSISEQLNAFSSRMAALPEAMSEIQHQAPCTSHNYPLLVPLKDPLPIRHPCEKRAGGREVGTEEETVNLCPSRGCAPWNFCALCPVCWPVLVPTQRLCQPCRVPSSCSVLLCFNCGKWVRRSWEGSMLCAGDLLP